jgi:hypothetical protein
MDITANSHRAFLFASAGVRRHQHASVGRGYVRPVVRWTLLGGPRVPIDGEFMSTASPRLRAHATPPATAAGACGPVKKVAAAAREGKRRTFSHSLWTSTSASCLQDIRLSIQPSRVGMVAGSRLADVSPSGARPTSSMLVSILKMRRSQTSRRGWGYRDGRRRRSWVLRLRESNDVVASLSGAPRLPPCSKLGKWASGWVVRLCRETASAELAANSRQRHWACRFLLLFDVLKFCDAGTCKMGIFWIARRTSSSWMWCVFETEDH